MRLLPAIVALALALPSRAAPVDDVAALNWMFGTWKAQDVHGAITFEAWIGPQEGVMSGVSQTGAPGKKILVEFMKITAEPAGATFTATLPGEPPTPFVLVSAKDGEVIFENRTHDFPQRIIYRRCEVALCARIEGMVRGKLRFEEWRYLPVR